MRINEAAEHLGLSQRALKYYEKEGLLEVRRWKTATELQYAGFRAAEKNIAVPQAGDCDQRY